LPCVSQASDVASLVAQRDQIQNQIETQGKANMSFIQGEFKALELTPECRAEGEKVKGADEKRSPKCLAEAKKQILDLKAFEEKDKPRREKMKAMDEELMHVRLKLIEALEKKAAAPHK
jgi:hypothetical protein